MYLQSGIISDIKISMEDLRGKERNDNAPPQIGDWVEIIHDEPERRRAAHYLNSKQPFVVAQIREGTATAFLVARKDYRPGMYIGTSTSEVTALPIPVLAISMKKLRIRLKPHVIRDK